MGLLPAIVLVLAGTVAAVPGAGDCTEHGVQYSAPVLVPLADRVRLAPLAVPAALPDAGSQRRSPQGDAIAVVLQRPDFTRPGPWHSRIEVRRLRGQRRAWQLDFIDHGNNPVHLQWLNEELLFLRVWWGRIVSTDLILDLSTGRFSYVREANHGLAGTPCDSPG